MCSKESFAKCISIDIQMQIKKTIYLQEYKKGIREQIFIPYEKRKTIDNFEKTDKINNCCSLFVQDFEIKYMNNNNNIKPKECIFNSLPENNNNPFLSYAQLNDLNQKQIIDLRAINNIEEPDFLSLDNISSK